MFGLQEIIKNNNLIKVKMRKEENKKLVLDKTLIWNHSISIKGWKNSLSGFWKGYERWQNIGFLYKFETGDS